MRVSGIYKIQSKIKPDRIYIGSSKHITKRWNEHLCTLRKNKHCSIKLQRHFNKYGESDLQFSIILGCDDSDLLKIEQYFLDSYTTYFNTNNIVTGGAYKMSEETRLKMSKSKMGNKNSLGFKHTKETREKWSHKSQETIEKMRQGQRRRRSKP